VITLAEHQLSTDLHVEAPSTSSAPLEFQALLHNYIAAPADKVLISPLNGLSYFDKTDTAFDGVKTESRDAVDVRKFTDSVYQDAPGKYKVVWPGGGVEIKTKNFKDVVVWNPQETGAKMGDMEAQGWYVTYNGRI
jgi:glucose-6-phosphate 1-epimerase